MIKRMPIRNQLKLIVLGLMVVLFGLQLLMQSVFMDAMRSLYANNVEAAISRVGTELHLLLRQQEEVVAHIAGEPDVIAYGGTRESEDRFTMAYSFVLPIVRSAAQNLRIEHVIIYDITEAWYQFIGALHYEDYHSLRAQFENIGEGGSKPVWLHGQLYLATAMPLMTIERNLPQRNGMVVALTGAASMRAVLDAQASELDEQVLLHDGERILVSNNEALEGMPLAEGPISPRSFYVSSEEILPGMLATVSIPRDRIFPQQTPFILAFLVVALFSVLALLVTLGLSGRWFTRPITKVIEGMESLTADHGRLAQTHMPHIDRLVDGINELVDRLEATSQEMLDTQHALYESELEKRNAQLTLLKKQINAHFLYNCLTGIKALSDEGEHALAGEMAEGVGLLMRYTHSTQPTVNIFDEMIIIQRYVNVMNIRFRNRFQYTFDVDDRLVDFRMLRLLLQPLVENALVHGLEGQTACTCRLHITGTMEADSLVFVVQDNGVGIAPEQLAAIQQSLLRVDGEYAYDTLKGISLINIQKRVHTAYGLGFGLHIESEPGEGTTVTLRIPAVPD